MSSVFIIRLPRKEERNGQRVSCKVLSFVFIRLAFESLAISFLELSKQYSCLNSFNLCSHLFLEEYSPGNFPGSICNSSEEFFLLFKGNYFSNLVEKTLFLSCFMPLFQEPMSLFSLGLFTYLHVSLVAFLSPHGMSFHSVEYQTLECKLAFLIASPSFLFSGNSSLPR